MRFTNPIIVLLAYAALAGCAAPATATRGADTAVRAEPRRISDASAFPDAVRVATAQPARNAF
jgi:hypothetical protein